MTLRVRLGAVTTSGLKAVVVSDTAGTVSASISGGSAIITQPTNRLQTLPEYMGAGLVTFSGLSPFTRYTYTISLGADSVSGTFRTLPDNQETDFAFIVSTCDHPGGQQPNNIAAKVLQWRDALEVAGFPLLFQLHVDDLSYVDTDQVSRGVYVSTGSPELTGDPDDYALAWAHHIGMFPGRGKYQRTQRQEVYRTVPCVSTGGDHMVEGNHCRGRIGDSNYHGCNRLPGDAVPNLESTAIGEWQAFVGAANPDPLRSGELYWGFDAGPVRIAALDMTKTVVPYSPTGDNTIAGGYQDGSRYGSTQINDVQAYLDVATHPFKAVMFDAMLSQGQEPWLEWHATEAAGWKASVDAAANLNGTAGNLLVFVGDVHHAHVISYDKFWQFCPGVYEGSLTNESALRTAAYGWSGIYRGGRGPVNVAGDRSLSGFWVVKVHAKVSPKTLECFYVETGKRFRFGPVYLEAGAANNQWTYSPGALTYPRTKIA